MENEILDDQVITAQPQAENIKVRFNHQDMFLSPDEAVSYAQKGLKLDSLQPLLKELNYLSNLRNKSPLDTIREYVALDEEVTAQQLRQQFKDDENAFNDALLKYKSAKDNMRNELFKEEQEQFERNLADEFFHLKEICPEIDTFDKIPKEVLKNAKNESLLNSYLRFFHDEKIKIEKNNDVNKNNLIAAIGELNGGGENFDTLLSAFIKGLNS